MTTNENGNRLRPIVVLLVLAVTVFVTEGLLLLGLKHCFPSWPAAFMALVDAALLTVATTTVTLWLLVRPWQREMQHLAETRRKMAELANYPNENPNVVLHIDELGQIQYANPAGKELLHAWNTWVNGLAPPEIVALCLKAMNAGEQKQEQTCGDKLLLLTFNPVAATRYINVYGLDITDVRRAEEEIRRLSHVATHTDNAVLITDAYKRIQWCNQAFERISQYHLEEVRGKHPGTILQGPETKRETVREMSRELAAHKGFNTEVLNYRKNQEPYWVDIEVRPILNAQGQVTNWIGLGTDITERKRMDQELRAARRNEARTAAHIQQVLLFGRPPDNMPGIGIGVMTLPSQWVDGDFFEMIPYDEHHLDVIVGDVMGKGLPAALLGAAVKSEIVKAIGEHSMLEQAWNQAGEPEHILTHVLKEMGADLIKLESFVTLFYARLDLDRMTLNYIDCGHTPTLHYRCADSVCSELTGANMPIGFVENERFERRQVALTHNDVLVLYSDGVTDARNPDGETFGLARLKKLVAQHHTLSAHDLVEKIHIDLSKFTVGQGMVDDFTCVVLKLLDHQAADRNVDERHTLEIPGDLDKLPLVRCFIANLCQQACGAPCAQELLAPVNVAVTEVVSNIVTHVFAGNPQHTIRLEGQMMNDRFAIDIYYWGPGFEPGNVCEPDINSLPEHGMGLYIIQKSMDDVSYHQDVLGRCCISLRKKLHTTWRVP